MKRTPGETIAQRVSYWTKHIEAARKYEHGVTAYCRAKVLEESGIVVSSFLAAGADHMAFVTPDNQVLKLTTSLFPNQFFERQFHLHIFDSQIIDGGGGFKLQLYKQPRGKFVSVEQYRAFLELIKRLEYVLFDGGIEQLSLYNGGAKLHDPFAVQRDSRLGRP